MYGFKFKCGCKTKEVCCKKRNPARIEAKDAKLSSLMRLNVFGPRNMLTKYEWIISSEGHDKKRIKNKMNCGKMVELEKRKETQNGEVQWLLHVKSNKLCN